MELNLRREQFLHEICDVMSSEITLRPFVTVLVSIRDQFRGIELISDDLDPITFIHNRIFTELSRTAEIPEELFMIWLMQLPVLKRNIVNVRNGSVWEPTLESFEKFKAGEHARDIVVSSCMNIEQKIQSFSIWVIQLCDWESQTYSNVSGNRKRYLQ